MSVGDLQARLGHVTVLDVRFRLLGPPTRTDYDSGHIPGAWFVDLGHELSGTPGEHGRHPLPDMSAFEHAMRRIGVEPDRPVVAYDQSDGQWAARAWWLLRFAGHDEVAVLDGGYAAWVEAGLPVSHEEPPPTDTSFCASPGRLPVLDSDEAARLARDGVLLDARAAARYAGATEPIDAVAGHIPGAVSAPATGNVDESGRFLEAARLRERFESLGATAEQAVGVYCGSGVTATQEILAFEVAGLPTPALYADSWSGWITDPTRPVSTGDAPG